MYVYIGTYRKLFTPLPIESLSIPNRLKVNVFSREKNNDTKYYDPKTKCKQIGRRVTLSLHYIYIIIRITAVAAPGWDREIVFNKF